MDTSVTFNYLFGFFIYFMNHKPIDPSPVNVEVNSVRGIALQPFEKPTPELLKLACGKKRALFIDLAASPAMKEIIEALQRENVDVVAYRDHHYAPESTDPRDQKTVESANSISAELGEKARFETRDKAPSCARLVQLGEAIREKIDLILHHGDTDGFFGYLKACGVSYEGLEDDADILDSRGDESKLTEHGRLFRDALVSIPPFNKDRPDISNRAKEALQREFIAYVENGFSEESAAPLKAKALAAAEQAETTAELVRLIEILEGCIAFVDTTVAGKRKYDPKALADAMERIEGVKVTAQKKNFGPLVTPEQRQISIARLSRDEQTDLRAYVPENAESGVEHGRIFNTPFLLHVREDLFEDFVNRFKK